MLERDRNEAEGGRNGVQQGRNGVQQASCKASAAQMSTRSPTRGSSVPAKHLVDDRVGFAGISEDQPSEDSGHDKRGATEKERIGHPPFYHRP